MSINTSLDEVREENLNLKVRLKESHSSRNPSNLPGLDLKSVDGMADDWAGGDMNEEGNEHAEGAHMGRTVSDAKDPITRLEELWDRINRDAEISSLQPPSSSSGSSVQYSLSSESNSSTRLSSEAGLRDWSGYLTKGRRIGGGAFGDVYMGRWEDLPPLAINSTSKSPGEANKAQMDQHPPNVVVKVIRSFMKDAMEQDHAKVTFNKPCCCTQWRTDFANCSP